MSSFQHSSSQTCVRYVFLTGKPGIGKSTMVKKVCEVLTEKNIYIQGFYTEEIRQHNTRIGFDVVGLNGSCGPLARVADEGSLQGPKVGKYVVNIKAFEDLVMPIFDVIPPANSLLVLDEIGKMEMLSKTFCKQVQLAFEKPQTILATIPLIQSPFVKYLQSLPSSQTFQLNYTNRNTLLPTVIQLLSVSLGKH